MTLGEALLTPTRIYVKQLLALSGVLTVKSASHITGGGFYENIPRALPLGCTAVIEKNAVRPQPIFDVIRKAGGIPERDMFNTYNMGVGMVVTVAKEAAGLALDTLRGMGEAAFALGEVASGETGVAFR
jgi:phosphoribosylformylglycinamidine cyclo-ligase